MKSIVVFLMSLLLPIIIYGQQSYALLIGVDNAPKRPLLNYAKKDAKRMKYACQKAGFKNITFYSEEQAQSVEIGNRIKQITTNIQKKDTLYFYFRVTAPKS